MKKPEVNPDRRNFLRMLGLAGAGTVVAAAAAPIMFSERFSGQLHQVRQTRTLMSTYVQITALDGSAAKAEDAVNNVFADMARLESLLTRFNSSSPVAELNRQGKVANAPAEMLEVLAAAGKVHQASSGRFDVTILPLMEAVQASAQSGARFAGQDLASQDLASAASLVGFDKLSISGQSVSLARSGMAITLDGIAKGYIVDKAIACLADKGIKHALVNAGGDMRALGGKSDNSGWQILVQDPADKNAYLAKLEINNKAVATSGNYEAYFDQARMFGHIVSPATPAQSAGLTSASVVAPTCMVADALATALFASGDKNALNIISGQSQLGGMVVERSGRQHSLRFA